MGGMEVVMDRQKMFSFKDGDEITVFVPYENINYILAAEDGSSVFLKDGTCFQIEMTASEIQATQSGDGF